ncbi:MAG: pyruvate dehydrogenase (acetyl-transferring), homodimeric type [Candidatus Schekmanbacteria bacterium]|nr:pyruvate dehydrogenase (acetyl-transferring), homodimeric type [Candidatus Schekmanbacteria bacterium]
MSEPTGRLAPPRDDDPEETREWLDSLEYVLRRAGSDRVVFLIEALRDLAQRRGVQLPFSATTPYINTIPRSRQPAYPGNRELERRIKSCVRWNAMAMVVRANTEAPGIGGHISTYASAATLLEVGFNHFFRRSEVPGESDLVYFQGHASPGVYARAFLEGRISRDHLRHFRRELSAGGGLSSYPHPWLMPSFWQFPTVSMGLSPIMAIYQARFNRYLEHRGLLDTSRSRVWAFLGDGETDEPEALGAISLAGREKLSNLIFIVNCNLQRLDGPVRGNGKIIQELEGVFRGAGWNVIKVIWGDDWDPLLANDPDGKLVRRMGEVVDGQYQKYTVSGGAYIREHFFGTDPELLRLVAHLSDDQLSRLRRGGHDPEKVYAAYLAAVSQNEKPSVILAKTIKGYGLGEAGEGRNITHQQKKLNESEMREFRSRFAIPLGDDEIERMPFYRPPDTSPEIQYMKRRREVLGGFLPERSPAAPPLEPPGDGELAEFFQGSGGHPVSTTMAFVRLLARLLRHPRIGKLVVPIIPDEARTFGMDALFRQCGIYAAFGQLYEPVDSDTLLYYREAADGQILEEGITEAGATCSFIAAGTAYAAHGINTIPFYIFYSMFGLQRVGDLIWAAADMRCRGFLMGATAGRTTLLGEGLQHQDGHSHLLATAVPNLMAYDPAYAYEICAIVLDGLERMFARGESVFYYITLQNESYEMPAMPEGARQGILRGMYKLRPGRLRSEGRTADRDAGPRAHLLGSGAIAGEVLRAQELLEADFGVAADVWSVTSYKELRREALECEHWNRLHPEAEPRRSYLEGVLAGESGAFVAATDFVKLVPEQIARWVPGGLTVLGTDGFGRSDTRAALRRFFEVDAESIAHAALSALAGRGELGWEIVARAQERFGLEPGKLSPVAT